MKQSSFDATISALDAETSALDVETSAFGVIRCDDSPHRAETSMWTIVIRGGHSRRSFDATISALDAETSSLDAETS